jgi:hypothetical protein
MELSDYNWKISKGSSHDTCMVYDCNCMDDYKLIVWIEKAIASEHGSKSIGEISKIFPDTEYTLRMIKRDIPNENWHHSNNDVISAKLSLLGYTSKFILVDMNNVLTICQLLGAEKIGATSRVDGKICGKCGGMDEYASYNKKYNEVRCYLHCE